MMALLFRSQLWDLSEPLNCIAAYKKPGAWIREISWPYGHRGTCSPPTPAVQGALVLTTLLSCHLLVGLTQMFCVSPCIIHYSARDVLRLRRLGDSPPSSRSSGSRAFPFLSVALFSGGCAVVVLRALITLPSTAENGEQHSGYAIWCYGNRCRCLGQRKQLAWSVQSHNRVFYLLVYYYYYYLTIHCPHVALGLMACTSDSGSVTCAIAPMIPEVGRLVDPLEAHCQARSGLLLSCDMSATPPSPRPLLDT